MVLCSFKTFSSQWRRLLSKASLLLEELSGVAILDSKGLDTREFLCLDHLNPVALLIDHQTSLFALNDRFMLSLGSVGLVVGHLTAQVNSVSREGALAFSHLSLLLFLISLLSGDNAQELITICLL